MTVIAFEPHSDDVCLFGSFLAQQHRAHIVTVFESHVQAGRGLPITQQQRFAENAAAARELGLSLEQWPFRDDRPDWAGVEQWMRDLDAREQPTLVLAPALEEGGHDQHNGVSEAAHAVFGGRLQPYLTYRRGFDRTVGRRVEFEAEQLVRKLRALACFRSQIGEPSTRPWFIGAQSEYVPG